MSRSSRKGRRRSKLKRLAVALAPAIGATAVVAIALAVRVTTPIQLDVLVRAMSLTLAGGHGHAVPLLNNSTVISRLVIDRCHTVAFPPLSIETEGSEPAISRVSFRCDERVHGAKVMIRARGFTGEDVTQPLANLNRIEARAGDRVRLELLAANPPEIRLEVARDVAFDFSLNDESPFEIVTEFADASGLAEAVDPDGVKTFRASLAEKERLAKVTSRGSLNVVISPVGDPDATELFRKDLDVPIAAISLFRRDDVDGAFVSTAIDGTLKYAERPDVPEVAIRNGEHVRLQSTTGFHLTQLRVDRTNPGLWFRVEGSARELATGTTDRRLRLLDRVMTDWSAKVVGLIVALAGQLAWLWRFWQRPA